MPREPKNYDHLLGGRAKGLSDAQLSAHFTLYKGYVNKLNELTTKLEGADRGAPNYSFNEYSELRRREPVAFNGTVLHELYFENLGDGSTQASDAVKALLARSFGSYDAWVTDARACLLSAHGWTLLVYDYATGRLYNNLVHSEHHAGLFANTHIMAAFDAWEHAYFFDYQTAKAKYVDAVLSGANWDAITNRLQTANLLPR
jgi:Fe-Mn family superoxide dismutase